MHVLSELRNPLFTAPDRTRALRALQLSRLLKEQNQTKPWQAVKSMIDRLLGEQGTSLANHPEPSPLTSGSVVQPLPMMTLYPSRPMSSYSQPPTTQQLMTQNIKTEVPMSVPPIPAMPTQPAQSTQPTQPMQTDQSMHWNDFNFDNIIGNPQTNADLPEFDFVSKFRFH